MKPILKFHTINSWSNNLCRKRYCKYNTTNNRTTRNATIVQETVTQTQSVTNSSTQLTRIDPLAQTFLISEDGGCFVSSVDLFFSEKDTNLPVWVELREVLNGYGNFQHLYHLVEKF